MCRLINRINSRKKFVGGKKYKKLIQLFETEAGRHQGISMINILETIDTNYTTGLICSVDFVRSENRTQMLLVGIGEYNNNNFELQIFVKQNNYNENNNYVFRNSLQFEDTNVYSAIIMTNKHIFVKAYQ